MTETTSTRHLIERSILVAAPLERVWDLVSVPGWWVTEDDGTAGDRTPGSVTAATTPGGTVCPVQVVELVPRSYAAFRWASQFPDQELAEGRTTLVEFTLEPVADGVLVRVRESGFDRLDAPEEVRRAGIEDNTSGWEQMLALLDQHARG